MKKKVVFEASLLVTLGVCTLLTGGCMPAAFQEEAPKDASVVDVLRQQGQGPRPRPQTWVDCELFDGVVTPANFNPESDPFDELYTMPMSPGFMNGAPLISDSKPGDRDYNGGRWHLNVLSAGVDPATYADACSVEDLDLNDFDSTPTYFECPSPAVRLRNA